MTLLIRTLAKAGLFTENLDYHVVRASMVLIFVIFGYQKWLSYDAQLLVPFVSNGPLIFWLYPVFGVQGATWFLGASEWLFGSLIFLGFWDKRLGLLGALGSTFTFIGTVTIIPFFPNGWTKPYGFPAMTIETGFLLKDIVLLAVSLYLVRQDALRVHAASSRPAGHHLSPQL